MMPMFDMIFFDMDGTLANLYGDPDWLKKLIAEDASVYANALPLLDMELLAKSIHKIQAMGIKIGVISWLSKNGTADFDMKVTQVKREWLKSHLPSVFWDEIHICKYGTPKQIFSSGNDLLFDDEKPNRMAWEAVNHNLAFDVNHILAILEAIQ